MKPPLEGENGNGEAAPPSTPAAATPRRGAFTSFFESPMTKLSSMFSSLRIGPFKKTTGTKEEKEEEDMSGQDHSHEDEGVFEEAKSEVEGAGGDAETEKATLEVSKPETFEDATEMPIITTEVEVEASPPKEVPTIKSEEKEEPTSKTEEAQEPAPKSEEKQEPSSKTEEELKPAPKSEEKQEPTQKSEETQEPTSKTEEEQQTAPKSEEPTQVSEEKEKPVKEEVEAPSPKGKEGLKTDIIQIQDQDPMPKLEHEHEASSPPSCPGCIGCEDDNDDPSKSIVMVSFTDLNYEPETIPSEPLIELSLGKDSAQEIENILSLELQ